MVELMVVLAIVAALSSLALSANQIARQQSESTKCLSSMRQVGLAIQLYVGEHDGRLPDTGHVRAEDGTSLSWLNTLAAYLGSDFIGRCPANRQALSAVTYAWNDLLTETTGEGISLLGLRAPSTTLVVAETADGYSSEHFHFAGARSRVTYNQFKSAVGVERHVSGANYLFADSHIETLAVAEVKSRLSAADSTFLIP